MHQITGQIRQGQVLNLMNEYARVKDVKNYTVDKSKSESKNTIKKRN